MLTVVRGLATPRTREFRVGEPQDAASVGSTGDWQLRGPGVEAIHAYLYFDGEHLYVQSALEGQDIVCGGQRVGNDWERVEVASVLEIGTARITLSQVVQARAGASAMAHADPLIDDHDYPDATMPMAKPAPIVISPKGAALVTGEERTSFVALGPSSGLLLDDDEATRFPTVVRTPPPPSFGDDDEATRMVSLEARAVTGEYVPAPKPIDVADPYDDLQERTHASAGISGIGTGMASAARAALDAREMGHVSAVRAAGSSGRLPDVRARDHVSARPEPRRDSRPPPAPLPGPISELAPEPRANRSQITKGEASRARASADILGPSLRGAAKVAQDAEVSAVSRSIGDMTRVGPLAPDVDAARKQAIALASGIVSASSLQAPSALAPSIAVSRGHEAGGKLEETKKRRQQKTARVRGPDGSGGYTPPPPPMALPTEAPKGVKPPSGIKKAFDAFATHFEEVNNFRKLMYLASPFLVLSAAYILFGPDPPKPPGSSEIIVKGDPSVALPQPVVPDASSETEILARPDAGEIVLPEDPSNATDAGAPSGKPTKPGKVDKDKKPVTNERLAADAYAAGQLDLAIQRYRALLDDPTTDPAKAPVLIEVLRILEGKKAAGAQEHLEQAPPTTKSRDRPGG